jgi:hypothetical protein
MRAINSAIAMLFVAVALSVTVTPASAACRNFEASHNGTDMFHETGAEGAAINKLMAQVESWKRERGIKKVRMTRVRTKCGPWFTKYLLPHRHCVAKARACG